MSEKKFCSQCGKELKENAKFCNYCGAPVPSESMPEPEGTGDTNKKTRRLLWIIIVIAIIVVVVIVSLLVVRSRNRETYDTQTEIAATEADEAKTNTDDVVAEETVEEETVEEPDVTSASSSTPEEFMSYVYKTYFISEEEIDAEKVWDDCVSDITKELGYTNKDTYIDNLTNNVRNNGLKYLSYDPIDSEDYGNGIFRVTGNVKYMASEEQHTEEINEFVIVDEDQYKVLLDGMNRKEECTISQESGDVVVTNVTVYYCVDNSIRMRCTLENHSSNDVSLGWVSGSQIDLNLSNGETRYYEPGYGTPTIISAAGTEEITIPFNDVNASIQSMTINSIHTLVNGLPFDANGASYITVSFE